MRVGHPEAACCQSAMDTPCLAATSSTGRPLLTAVLTIHAYVGRSTLAIGVMRAARQRGLAIPGDISLVGFDDIDDAEHLNPPLTTVHQPVREKGAEAAKLLLSAIDRADFGQPEHRHMETRLIVRGSTCPLPRERQEVKPVT